MTLFRLCLLAACDTIQEERWIRAATRKDAETIARRTVKHEPKLLGFELWREDCRIHAARPTSREK